MKGRSIDQRLRFALAGLRDAFVAEPSFRIQLLAAVFAVGTLIWLQPPLVWTALVVVMIALVLAAELINTALEHILDGLHPEQSQFVRIAKDCSAAAVLLLSVAAGIVFVLMVAAVL